VRFALGLLVVLGAACGAEDGPESVACPDNCMCAAGHACEFDCGTAGCMLAECLGGDCRADCPGGSCNLDCDMMGSCNYDCAGGSCSSDCDQGSTCDVRCPAGNCQILCDEGSTCTLDCTGASMECSLLCEGDGRGTCIGNCNVPSCG